MVLSNKRTTNEVYRTIEKEECVQCQTQCNFDKHGSIDTLYLVSKDKHTFVKHTLSI